MQLPLFLLTPTLLSACEGTGDVKPTGKSVLIVGAGISGLAAAKKLSESGFSVQILESQDKVGGRLRTDRSLGVGFDEGASWIHGIKKNPITTLAEQAGMTTFETVDSSRMSYDQNGTVRSAATYDDAEDELYKILNTLYKKGNATESFKTIFDRNYPSKATDRLWKFLLSTYVTFDTGDLDKLSSLLYNEGKEFGGIEKIAINGYDTIANHLSKGLTIRLNERVSAINYAAEKVNVVHSSGTTEADFVLVTVPLGVLKAQTISFNPPLPVSKQTAISKVGMNCVNKFLLQFPTAFWPDVQYISYTPEIADKFNYFVNVKKFHPSVNALMTFAYADYARQTETMTDADVIAEIMQHLKAMYGSSIPSPTAMLRTRWQSNVHSLGAYSYTAVGTEMHHFEDLAAAVQNKLFFGGEHTHIDYFSTVHGAYLSGLREADKIINQL